MAELLDRRSRSPRPTGGKPKAGTLGTLYPTLALAIWCRPCRHSANIPVAGLADRWGANLPCEAFRQRLTCSRCGARDADYQVVPIHTGGMGG